MKHIYYLIGLIFILNEISWVVNPKKRSAINAKYLKLSEENKGNKKWDEIDPEYKNLLFTKGCISVLVICWLFLGLFTYNWFLFMWILLFNFMIIGPISKTLEHGGKKYLILHWFNSIISLIFGLFVIVNTYHLHIDVYNWFIKTIGL